MNKFDSKTFFKKIHTKYRTPMENVSSKTNTWPALCNIIHNMIISKNNMNAVLLHLQFVMHLKMNLAVYVQNFAV